MENRINLNTSAYKNLCNQVTTAMLKAPTMQPKYPELHSMSELQTELHRRQVGETLLHSPDIARMSHHSNIWQKKVIYYSCLP